MHFAECGWTEEQIRAYTGHEDFKALRPYFTIGSKKKATVNGKQLLGGNYKGGSLFSCIFLTEMAEKLHATSRAVRQSKKMG